MTQLRQLRFASVPPIGEFVNVHEPNGEVTKWVVVAFEDDPTGLWAFEHFTASEGGPDITPQSYLVSLRKLP